MQENKTFVRFSLQHVKLLTNCTEPYKSMAIQNQQSQENSKQISNSTESHNILLATFDLKIFQQMNYHFKSKAVILAFHLNDIKITIDLECREGEYSLEHVCYYCFVRAQCNSNDFTVKLQIKENQSQKYQTSIRVSLSIQEQNKAKTQLFESLKFIYLQIGSLNPKYIVNNQISNFKIHSCFQQPKKQPPVDTFANKFILKTNTDYSFPLGMPRTMEQVKRSFGKDIKNVQDIEKMIQKLDEYTATANSGNNKMYLCHDMKGGYIEDTNFQNNKRMTKKIEDVSYRCLHLQQCQIFNYFSHYSITIPPKHWRLLCQKYKVKCLGTFILQPNHFYLEEVLQSREFAYELIYLAKKCRFDGYLLNIEVNIQQITKLKQWIRFLTQKMHELIPNSTIIWYDSILASNGQIQYQNQLNQNNLYFYTVTDGFFTNYWWNQQSLQRSLQTLRASQVKNKLYIGNDCFGRNTYAGGKYNIYQAANTIINESKDQLSIALFGCGFTYQDNNAENNRDLFYLQENSMYRGLSSQVIPIKWNDVINRGQGWKIQGDWAVTSYQICQRMFKLQINSYYRPSGMLKFKFMVIVAGTGPNFQDPYKIILQVYDQTKKQIIHESTPYNYQNLLISSQQQKQQMIEMQMEAKVLIQSQNICLRIIQLGKDTQHWAGNYGVRFKNEQLIIGSIDESKNWISKIPVNYLNLHESYNSYCNTGYGNYFYYQGNQYQSNYDYLSDMDIPHTYSINTCDVINLYHGDSFIGGSSFKVQAKTIKLIRLLIPAHIQLNNKYYFQLILKHANIHQLQIKYLTKNQEDKLFSLQLIYEEMLQNEWMMYTYQFIQKNKPTHKEMKSRIDLDCHDEEYLLGGVRIIQKNSKEIKLQKEQVNKQQKEQLKLQCEIQRSMIYTPTPSDQNHINLKIQCSHSIKRLIVKIGEQYACWCPIIQGKGYLANIILKSIQVNMAVLIQDLDSQLHPKTIICYKITAKDLQLFHQEGSIKFQEKDQ